jgi:hypothetical protein
MLGGEPSASAYRVGETGTHARPFAFLETMTQPPMSDRDPGLDAQSATPPKPEKASVLDDFMDIFYAPSSVFARRANSSFFVPMIIVTVLLGVIFMANRDLIDPIMEAEFARAMSQNPQTAQLTPEQLEAGRKFAGTFATVGAFIGPPFVMLALGFAIWLVGKFFDARQTLNAAIVVASFAYVPRVVEGIVNRAQGLMVDPESLNSRFSLSLGLGRFFDADTTSPMLLGIIGRIDVFTIWVTVLIAIGLAVTGKISRGKAAIAAAVVWFVGALPSIAGALRAGG